MVPGSHLHSRSWCRTQRRRGQARLHLSAKPRRAGYSFVLDVIALNAYTGRLGEPALDGLEIVIHLHDFAAKRITKPDDADVACEFT